MAYPVKAVANKFLELARRDGVQLSPMKLQKLVYYAHGWYLAITGRPLLLERIQAWRFGPVIPELYQEFKLFGSAPIVTDATEFAMKNGQACRYRPRLEDFRDNDERRDALDVIQQVWKQYGPHSAVRLSNATHQAGTPWQQVYQDGSRFEVIPDEVIQQYFQGLMQRGGNQRAE